MTRFSSRYLTFLQQRKPTRTRLREFQFRFHFWKEFYVEELFMVGWCVVAVSIIYSRFQLTGTRSFLSVISQSPIRHTLRLAPPSSLVRTAGGMWGLLSNWGTGERNKTPSDHLYVRYKSCWGQSGQDDLIRLSYERTLLGISLHSGWYWAESPADWRTSHHYQDKDENYLLIKTCFYQPVVSTALT